METSVVTNNTRKMTPAAVCKHPILQRQGETDVCLACGSAVVIQLRVELAEQPEDTLARALSN